MAKAKSARNTTVTVTDVQLAGAYYPILVEAARQERTLTYGELVKQAKSRFPDLSYVKAAIAVSAGRRLDVVRQFTNEQNLPDVTALVINQADGECGKGFTDSFNPELVRQQVFAFDWKDVSTGFDSFLSKAMQEATPRKRRTHAVARRLMWAHYKQYKNELPASIANNRDKLITLLADGYSATVAYEKVIGEAEVATLHLAA